MTVVNWQMQDGDVLAMKARASVVFCTHDFILSLL
jgi:hypothetical protein